MRLKTYQICLGIFLYYSAGAYANDQGWFDADFAPTTKMVDVSVHTQSRVWATCAVAHDIASVIKGSEAPDSASATALLIDVSVAFNCSFNG